MASTIAQHGMCFYSKEIAAVVSRSGSVSKMDLASEMLASSRNTMALGKLVGQDMGIENSRMGSVNSVSHIPRYRIVALNLLIVSFQKQNLLIVVCLMLTPLHSASKIQLPLNNQSNFLLSFKYKRCFYLHHFSEGFLHLF